MIERLVKYAVVGYGAGAVFAILLFDTLAVQGQMLKPIVGGGYSAGGGGGGFQGIGDAASGAKAHWGVIAYSAATRGQAMLSLCDTAGANCADASTDGTTGLVSSTQTRGSACGSTPGVDACLIQYLYDDSGANYCSGATPCKFDAFISGVGYLYFIPNAIGTIPAIKCVGASHYAVVTPFPGYSQPGSMVAGVRVDVSPGGGNYAGLMNAGLPFAGGSTMGFSNATIDAIRDSGSFILAPPAVSAGTFYSAIGTQAASGSSGSMSINGSTTTGTIGTAGDPTSILQICISPDGVSYPLTASILEMAFYNADIASSVAAINTNMRANGGY